MLTLYIIGGIVLYLIMGVLTIGLGCKMWGESWEEVKKDHGYFLCGLLWPLFLLFIIAIFLCMEIEKIKEPINRFFKFIFVKIFRLPENNQNQTTNDISLSFHSEVIVDSVNSINTPSITSIVSPVEEKIDEPIKSRFEILDFNDE